LIGVRLRLDAYSFASICAIIICKVRVEPYPHAFDREALLKRKMHVPVPHWRNTPVNVSMVLFPIADDCISILAVNTDHQQDCWERRYATASQVSTGLEQIGMIKASEAGELESDLMFLRGCPIIKGVVEREDLEDAGFSPIVHKKAN
jgi:hypothetical protein